MTVTGNEPARSNADIIGRDDVNDVDAIFEVTNTDRDEVVRHVQNNADTLFTWDYEKGARPRLNKLYEKAKHAMWDGEQDLDWSIDVDLDEVVEHMRAVTYVQNQSAVQTGRGSG